MLEFEFISKVVDFIEKGGDVLLYIAAVTALEPSATNIRPSEFSVE